MCTCKQVAGKLVAKASIKDSSLPWDKGQKVKSQVSEVKLLINSLNDQRNTLSKPHVSTWELWLDHSGWDMEKRRRVAFISWRRCRGSTHYPRQIPQLWWSGRLFGTAWHSLSMALGRPHLLESAWLFFCAWWDRHAARSAAGIPASAFNNDVHHK